MGEYEPILRREFDAADGSFLLQLRCSMVWDREAFSRLAAAMEQCAADHAGRESIERWIAKGFWYVSWFVPQWSGHPDFPRPEAGYHQRACERLFDLAYCLFMGSHVLESGGPFDPL